MRRLTSTILVLFFLIPNSFAQTEEIVSLETDFGKLEGTLMTPEGNKKFPLALIIAGSGPTDRDGNNTVMKNNSLKMLAKGLANNGIGSLRYDKRGVGNSKEAGIEESDLRFENYIEDAKGWVALLNKDKRFKKFIIIGHSQGSLIGMIASQSKNVDKYVSIAGVGRPAADILREQLAAQPPIVLEYAEPILKKLKKGETTEEVPPALYSLFRPSVQSYMISWFKYNPQVEIAKLDKPILIIQGTTDIQITVFDANKLSEANNKAEKLIIEGMNHVLKESVIDRPQNIATYSDPELPLINGLIEKIAIFINH